MPCHVVPPSQHVPSSCTRAMTARVSASASPFRGHPHQHLIQDDVVQDPIAPCVAQAVGHAPGETATAVDQRRQPVAAERCAARRRRARARPRRDSSGTNSRGSRSVACSRRCRPPRRVIARRCDSECAVSTTPESYGTFSHLCASVAIESARPDARRRATPSRARARPEAERAVDVQPRAARLRAVGDRRRSDRTRRC